MDRPLLPGRACAALQVAAMPLFVVLALIAAIAFAPLLLLLLFRFASDGSGTDWFAVCNTAALFIAITNVVGATRAIDRPTRSALVLYAAQAGFGITLAGLVDARLMTAAPAHRPDRCDPIMLPGVDRAKGTAMTDTDHNPDSPPADRPADIERAVDEDRGGRDIENVSDDGETPFEPTISPDTAGGAGGAVRNQDDTAQ